MDQTTPQCVSASSIRSRNLLTSCAALLPRRQKLAREDFIIHRRDGLFAYNLAVVVDDRFQGVSEIVRGADLIEPTVRQISLYQLGWKVPDYIHLPLALNPQGAKLPKQNHAPALPKSDRPVLIAALQFLGQQAEAHWQDLTSANPPVSRQKTALYRRA